MKTIAWCSLLIGTVVLSACAPQVAQESAELSAKTEAWTTAFNAGDTAAIAALYAEDGRSLAPNAPLVVGRDGIQATFKGMIDAGLQISLEEIETLAAGDLGHKVGRYTLSSDGAVVDSGKYVETWRNIDGEWLITNDIFNSDLPADPATTHLLATHEVRDPARWLAAWEGDDGRRAMFAEHGVAHVRVFQSRDNPKLTGLLIGVTDMEKLGAMLDSPEGQAAKKEDGVIDSTMRTLFAVE